MASIATFQNLFNESGGQKTVLYRLTGVNSGDQIDVSSVGVIGFKKVLAAVFISSTTPTGVVASVSGTVITLTLVGMSLDTLDLLVKGE